LHLRFIPGIPRATLEGMAKRRAKADPAGAAHMRRAIELALEGVRSNLGGPFGAVVVKEGQVIGEGQNRVTSSNDPTAHAEMVALRAACAKLGSFQLRGCELFTTCEPCPMCLAAAYWARIDKLHYACESTDAARAGFDDRALYEEIVKGPAERTLLTSQLLRDEALATFQTWMDKPDRTAY
jgi:tRNA(Arg) A34 adenosine deaminase TadA